MCFWSLLTSPPTRIAKEPPQRKANITTSDVQSLPRLPLPCQNCHLPPVPTIENTEIKLNCEQPGFFRNSFLIVYFVSKSQEMPKRKRGRAMQFSSTPCLALLNSDKEEVTGSCCNNVMHTNIGGCYFWTRRLDLKPRCGGGWLGWDVGGGGVDSLPTLVKVCSKKTEGTN